MLERRDILVGEKLREAVLNPRNHRYSASRGIPNLRRAICDLYARRFGIELDPEAQALTTIGAKEGLAHLMWVLVQPGDAAVVPSPSYPIHLFAPAFAGAVVEEAAVGDGEDFFGNVVEAFEREYVPKVLAIMMMAGFYDESGLWAYTAGLPAKTGVGGGIVAVVPGKMAIVGFSPRVNEAGNSVRSMKALEYISDQLGVNVFGSGR